MPFDPLLIGVAVALGVGLLIGADRERRKGEGSTRGAAGLRTFAVAAVTGAVAYAVGGRLLVATATLGAIALAVISYWRSREDDPGITTEVSLVLTTLLGALAMRHPAFAAGLGAIIAGLLHARAPLHGFVRTILSEQDIRDALIFAGATLVVLPLLPDQAIGPYDALRPRALWLIVILVMAVSTVGYVAIRIAGVRFGLPMAGLASGFISSIATIASMAEHAATTPTSTRAAAAGAILSTVATILQLTVVLAATDVAVLRALALPLLCAGIAALSYGAMFTLYALRQASGGDYRPERAFSLSNAIAFAIILAVVALAVAVLREWYGTMGAILAASFGGLFDTHAAAVSVASLAASGQLTPGEAAIPILCALSTNTAMKIVVAALKGKLAFASAVIPGLVFVASAAWAGVLLI